MLKAGEAAKAKNLKIATGLMCRHSAARQALIEQIREGALGQVQLVRAYRMETRMPLRPAEAATTSELLWQIRNPERIFWVAGGYVPRPHDPPGRRDVLAQGRLAGGRPRRRRTQPRQHRRRPGPRFVLHRVHLRRRHEGAGGGPLYRQLLPRVRHLRAWDEVRRAVLRQYPRADGDPIPRPADAPAGIQWKPEREHVSPYDVEWKELLGAIRNDRPYNEVQRSAYSDLATQMGRAAVHTGKIVTWDEALASSFTFCPNVDGLAKDSPVPVSADASGRYPAPVPGKWSEI